MKQPILSERRRKFPLLLLIRCYHFRVFGVFRGSFNFGCGFAALRISWLSIRCHRRNLSDQSGVVCPQHIAPGFPGGIERFKKTGSAPFAAEVAGGAGLYSK